MYQETVCEKVPKPYQWLTLGKRSADSVTYMLKKLPYWKVDSLFLLKHSIATWKKSLSLHGKFQESIHIGDQLLQVNEQQALDLPIIRTVIQSSSTETVSLIVFVFFFTVKSVFQNLVGFRILKKLSLFRNLSSTCCKLKIWHDLTIRTSSMSCT